ncbi:unnamed protein product [Dibothriocephalus latus]|uniref:Uncharacterized protein n=1 Tax=Dibothriocephalus latus TaxID=60516 RepID=A0A3P7MBT2_DIBLA|nr:unnamed protein product [Dibothriocephalus latus]
MPCNPMLLTKLLDIIIDASKPGSRVRVVTLNLALFLLFLLTRDASNVCQLSEDQRTQLNSAFVKSRSVLQDFYMEGRIREERALVCRGESACDRSLQASSDQPTVRTLYLFPTRRTRRPQQAGASVRETKGHRDD